MEYGSTAVIAQLVPPLGCGSLSVLPPLSLRCTSRPNQAPLGPGETVSLDDHKDDGMRPCSLVAIGKTERVTIVYQCHRNTKLSQNFTCY